jgi:phosphatidylserine decarboxylase
MKVSDFSDRLAALPQYLLPKRLLGLFVLTLVRATIVGSIATVWHGVVNPPRPRVMREWRYEDQVVALRRGQEMGRFLIGSTVVMLFPRNTVRLQADWMTARIVRMGEAMG